MANLVQLGVRLEAASNGLQLRLIEVVKDFRDNSRDGVTDVQDIQQLATTFCDVVTELVENVGDCDD